jgi:hypothetical protein
MAGTAIELEIFGPVDIFRFTSNEIIFINKKLAGSVYSVASAPNSRRHGTVLHLKAPKKSHKTEEINERYKN